MQSKLHVKVNSTACKIDLDQTVDMEMNSNKTMVKIQDLQPACQYKSTFTVGLFSDGKEISRGKLSEDIILNTMLSSPPVELNCKNKTVSAEPEIYGFTCTWKKPNK